MLVGVVMSFIYPLFNNGLTALGEAARDRLRAEAIGYIFQTFNLLQGHTARENVELGMAFGRGVDHARQREAAENERLRLELEELRHRLAGPQPG